MRRGKRLYVSPDFIDLIDELQRGYEMTNKKRIKKVDIIKGITEEIKGYNPVIKMEPRKKYNIRFTKKGSLIDMVVLPAMLFLVIIVWISAGTFLDKVTTQLNSSGIITSNETRDQLVNTNDRYPSLFDNLFMFLMIGMSLAVIALAFAVDSHPALYLFSLFLLVVLVVLNMMIANVYSDVTSQGEISVTASEFNLSDFAMTKLPIFMIVISIVVAVVTYAKNQGGVV